MRIEIWKISKQNLSDKEQTASQRITEEYGQYPSNKIKNKMGRMSETTRHHIINPDAVSAYKESSCNNQVQLVRPSTMQAKSDAKFAFWIFGTDALHCQADAK